MVKSVDITVGEVLDIIYDDKNPNLSYGIKVKLFDASNVEDSSSPGAITASPLNSNVLRVPLKGEIVLLTKAPSSYASGLSNSLEWYYIDIVNLQKDIHHNSIPTVSKFQLNKNPQASGNYNQAAAGNTNQEQAPASDKNFTELETVKPLQPYVGDLLIQGRYGNSIRMTTTPKSGAFTKVAKWKDGNPGAPITIIRNTEQVTNTGKTNDFTTEDFKNEDNVIVMTSGQSIEFEQSSGILDAIKSKKITSWKDDKWGKSPQMLLSSGRIIFNSWQKEIIAFAKNGIGLSSETTIAIDSKDSISLNSKKIELGDNATEPLILGNQFKIWINNLLTTLSTLTPISPMGPCAPLVSTPQWASVEGFRGQIDTFLSQVAFTKQLVNIVPGKSFKRKPSDRRLKENLKLISQSPKGINIYEFNFRSDPSKKYQGVVADELIGTEFENAVSTNDKGFLVVDYSLIDVKFIPKFDLEVKEINSYTEQAKLALITSKDETLSSEERLAAQEVYTLYSEKIKSKTDSTAINLLEGTIDTTSLQEMAVINSNYILINSSKIDRLSTNSLVNGIKSAELALKDVGIVEFGSSEPNQRIGNMLRNVNFKPNMYYAAAAVTTWWGEAGIIKEKFSTCSEWYDWAIKNNKLSTTPVIGSVALFRYGNFNKANGIGLVVEIDNDNTVTIVEADTMTDRQESGIGGIFTKVVNPIAIIGYILP